MSLVLNPGYNNVDGTEFPLNVSIHKGIFAYLKDFDISSFNNAAASLLNITKKIIPLSNAEVIAIGISTFTSGTNKIQQFSTDVNSKFNIFTPYNSTLSDGENFNNIVNYIKNIAFKSGWEIIIETYILPSTDVLANAKKFLSHLLYGEINATETYPDPFDFILDFIKPKLSASIVLSAGIEFSRDCLIPVKANGEIETDANIKSTILLGEAEFYFNTDGKIGINENINVTFPSSHPLAQIGNTGIRIGFANAKLDLSRTSNIAEADIDGRPVDFMGVFIQEAEIGLPATFVKQSTSASANGNMPALNPTRKIVGRNLLIGTGGFSGTVGLETNVAGAIPFNIGNFEIAITDFGLNFHMNKLLNSTISAKLNIPALTNGSQPTTVDVAVFIQNTDNFKVTGNFKTNPITINCFDVFDFDITTLTYEEIDNRKALGLSGILSFKNNLAGLGDLLPKNIAIEKLIIYDDGDIDFKLGAIPLPPFNLKLGVVEVGVHGLSYTVTKLGTRKYGVISFDGNVNSGLGGFDGQANGVKLYFSIDSGATDIFLRVESIRVSIKIPSNATPEQARVLIDGFISVRNTSDAPNAPTEYGGGISIVLNDLGIAAGAAIKMTPNIPSFIVDLSLELSVPIPLGPTGLGLYGFRGLIGNNYHL